MVLLCSEAGRFITGTDIKIDGAFPMLEVGDFESDGFHSGGYTMF